MCVCERERVHLYASQDVFVCTCSQTHSLYHTYMQASTSMSHMYEGQTNCQLQDVMLVPWAHVLSKDVREHNLETFRKVHERPQVHGCLYAAL